MTGSVGGVQDRLAHAGRTGRCACLRVRLGCQVWSVALIRQSPLAAAHHSPARQRRVSEVELARMPLHRETVDEPRACNQGTNPSLTVYSCTARHLPFGRAPSAGCLPCVPHDPYMCAMYPVCTHSNPIGVRRTEIDAWVTSYRSGIDDTGRRRASRKQSRAGSID